MSRPLAVGGGLTATGCALSAAGALLADPGEENDFGMVAALGPLWWAGLLCCVAAMVVALRREPGPRVRWHYLSAWVGIVLVLYGTPVLLTGAPRLEASYRHIGIIDQLAITGFADRSIDAYMSWPGFFALWAMLVDASGMPNDVLLWLGTLAPLVVMLGFLPPLLVILRHLTPDPRVKWLALTLFAALDWPGQDYFAPQAFAMGIYLCLIALVLEFGGRNGPVTRRQRAAFLLLLLAGMLTIVASHQLTPFVLILSLTTLVLVRRLMHWWLVPLGAGLVVLWLAVPAWPYIEGHLRELVEGVGDAEGAARSNFIDRLLAGTPPHKVVVAVRLGLCLLVWSLAALGVLLLRRRKQPWALPAALIGTPFLLLPLQAYGGELLIRVYFFGLPMAAFGAAVALGFLLARGPHHRWRTAGLAAVLVVACGSTVITRYGNDKGEGFTREEAAAFGWVYDQPDVRKVVLGLTHNNAWRYREYHVDDVAHREVERAEPGPPWEETFTEDRVLDVIDEIEEELPGRTVYVVWTATQSGMAELSANTPHGSVQSVVAELSADPRFRVVWSTERARVLRYEG